VVVSEGAFFILIDGIKKALDLTCLIGAFRGAEPRSYTGAASVEAARPCRLTLRVILLSLTQFWISDPKLDHRNLRFQLICPSCFCVFSLLRRCYKNTTAEGEKTHQQKAQRKTHLLLSMALVCSKIHGDGRGGEG